MEILGWIVAGYLLIAFGMAVFLAWHDGLKSLVSVEDLADLAKYNQYGDYYLLSLVWKKRILSIDLEALFFLSLISLMWLFFVFEWFRERCRERHLKHKT